MAFSRARMLAAFTLGFLLMAFCAEARVCMSPSKLYKGPCNKNARCTAACHKEHFQGGYCYGSSSTDGSEIWKALWKLQVQPKIRVFWWRVLKNFLPSHGELNRRHIRTNSYCPMCGCEMESLFHALTECDHACRYWEAAEGYFGFILPKLHPVTWARDLLDLQFMSKEKSAIAISVMWAIWMSRNKYAHEEIKYQPLRSMEIIDEFIKSLDIPPTVPVTKTFIVERWSPPEEGWAKINTDVAVCKEGRIGGVAAVARDHSGAFICARQAKYEEVIDALILELTACRDAILMAVARNMQRIIIETDCQTVCRMWNVEEDRSEGSMLINEMKSYLINFQEFKLNFVRRSANTPAHLCARGALALADHSVDHHVIPENLIAAVQSDFVPPN